MNPHRAMMLAALVTLFGTVISGISFPQTAPRFAWSPLKHKKIQLSQSETQIVFQVGLPTGRDQSTLLRISVDASYPVNVGLSKNYVETPDHASFDGSQLVICGHKGITKLIATCSISGDDMRRNIIVQDDNAAWLSHLSSKHVANPVTISIEQYDCENCQN